jgi:hypothetical protein
MGRIIASEHRCDRDSPDITRAQRRHSSRRAGDPRDLLERRRRSRDRRSRTAAAVVVFRKGGMGMVRGIAGRSPSVAIVDGFFHLFPAGVLRAGGFRLFEEAHFHGQGEGPSPPGSLGGDGDKTEDEEEDEGEGGRRSSAGGAIVEFRARGRRATRKAVSQAAVKLK